ncbi:MAG: PepSY domain-containing protein [Oscillospiraceae bacterium]
MKEKLKKICKPAVIGTAAVLAVILAVPAFASDDYIGLDRAKSAALEYAGVTGEVRYTEAKLDYGDRDYEIEFIADNVKYEMEVDAYTGAVREFEKKNVRGACTSAAGDSVTVTLDEAKTAALSHAGVSAGEAVFTKEKLDYENGVMVYDLEFYAAGYEYDYEIDAVTGDVLEHDCEKDDCEKAGRVPAASTGAAAAITLDEAENIALSHAGVSADSVCGLKSKSDYEHGLTVYEIEFKSGGYEYEFEIDAADGSILKYDREYDD